MGEVGIAATLAQFGIAGLIGWMWLVERRSATAREKQLCEMHDRLLEERRHADALLSVVTANTKALTALEIGQRGLTALLERMAGTDRRIAPA